MRRVGTGELRRQLSRHLRLAAAGTTFVVTNRGRPMAQLGPIRHGEPEIEEALARAEIKGLVTLPGRSARPRHRPVRLEGGVGLSDAVLQLRR